VEELNSSSAVVATMLTGLNVDEYFERTEPACCEPLSYLTDALGSTLALTDSTGAVFSTSVYEPFGRQPVGIGHSPSSPLITIPFEFTGREDDDGTVYYYRGRYYNTYLQRFLSQDPLEFAGGDTNLYAYALNSPTNLTDALGLDVIIEEYYGQNINVLGHLAVGVNQQQPVGLETTSKLNERLAAIGVTVPGQLTHTDDKPYASITIKTTPQQDFAVESAILRDILNPPNLKARIICW